MSAATADWQSSAYVFTHSGGSVGRRYLAENLELPRREDHGRQRRCTSTRFPDCRTRSSWARGGRDLPVFTWRALNAACVILGRQVDHDDQRLVSVSALITEHALFVVI